MAKKTIKSKAPDEQLPSKPPERIDTQLLEAGEYELSSDEDFTIDVPVKKVEKRWTIDFSDKPKNVQNVVFHMWSYEIGVDLRKKSTQYDEAKRVHFIDHDLLNRLKIQKLVKTWSFGENNLRLQLHHIGGILTDESFKSIMSLHPNILKFIVEKMNEILEFNG